MDFALSAEQQAVRDLFREFTAKEITPIAADLDAAGEFPRAVFEKIGALGFFAMRYPAPEGGGLDLFSYLIAVEEIARGSLSVAAAATMQSLMGTFFVHRFATGDLRARLLPAALAGKSIGAICMTEPDAGSDLFSMTTHAEERDGTWTLTGQKTWVTSAPVADIFTVFARTGERELSIFLVERDAKGLVIGRAIEKMGVKASITSEVTFENTPATAKLGERGVGIASLREVLSEIRLMTAGLALGVARAAYEDSLAYAAEREQFGRPINKFQAVQMHIADMATDLEAARALVLNAAWRSTEGLPNTEHSAMAKLFASEAALRVCDAAARIMASYGYATDYPIERYLRDVRFCLIGGGTSEILKINIAKGLTR